MGFNYSFRYHMNTYDFQKHAHPAIYKIDQRKCNWKIKTALHVFPRRCARTFLHCLWPILASLHSGIVAALYLFFLEIDIPFDRINSGVAARRKFRKKVISRNSDCIAPRLRITYLGEEVQKYFPVKFSQSTGSFGLNVSNHWINLDITETKKG